LQVKYAEPTAVGSVNTPIAALIDRISLFGLPNHNDFINRSFSFPDHLIV
jgi:hypothetical protein